MKQEKKDIKNQPANNVSQILSYVIATISLLVGLLILLVYGRGREIYKNTNIINKASTHEGLDSYLQKIQFSPQFPNYFESKEKIKYHLAESLYSLDKKNYTNINLFMDSDQTLNVNPNTFNLLNPYYIPSRKQIVLEAPTDLSTTNSLCIKGYEKIFRPEFFLEDIDRLINHEAGHGKTVLTNSPDCLETPKSEKQKMEQMKFIYSNKASIPQNLNELDKYNNEGTEVILKQLKKLLQKRDQKKLNPTEENLLRKINSYMKDYDVPHHARKLGENIKDEIIAEMTAAIKKNKTYLLKKDKYFPHDLFVYAITLYPYPEGNLVVAGGYLIPNPNDRLAALVAETELNVDVRHVDTYKRYGHLADMFYKAEQDNIILEKGEQINSFFYHKSQKIRQKNLKNSDCYFIKNMNKKTATPPKDKEMKETYQQLKKI